MCGTQFSSSSGQVSSPSQAASSLGILLLQHGLRGVVSENRCIIKKTKLKKKTPNNPPIKSEKSVSIKTQSSVSLLIETTQTQPDYTKTAKGDEKVKERRRKMGCTQPTIPPHYHDASDT